jgi:hypothetical protein
LNAGKTGEVAMPENPKKQNWRDDRLSGSEFLAQAKGLLITGACLATCNTYLLFFTFDAPLDRSCRKHQTN